jgi:hypothetical protein
MLAGPVSQLDTPHHSTDYPAFDTMYVDVQLPDKRKYTGKAALLYSINQAVAEGQTQEHSNFDVPAIMNTIRFSKKQLSDAVLEGMTKREIVQVIQNEGGNEVSC